MSTFLPMTLEENGGEPPDIVLVTGDAYVDHPSWGVAAIGRWLEAHGFTVGVIAQPDWTDVAAFQVLGRPRLFFGVTAGNMDSMVNRYTASRRLRTTDAYAPGGEFGLRPDRASIPYTSKCKQAFPGVPVVLGGIEASLRRLVHYDFWQDRIRGSILLDAKADLAAFGMAEDTIVEIARRLDAGRPITDCRDLPGVAYALGSKETPPSGADVEELPSLETCRTDTLAFNRVTMMMYRESNPHCGRTLIQKHGERWVVQNPPPVPISPDSIDRLHSLPFATASRVWSLRRSCLASSSRGPPDSGDSTDRAQIERRAGGGVQEARSQHAGAAQQGRGRDRDWGCVRRRRG